MSLETRDGEYTGNRNEGGGRQGVKLFLKGEIMEGRCKPPPSWSFGRFVVVVVVAAAVFWVLLMSRQLQTKVGSSRMRKR